MESLLLVKGIIRITGISHGRLRILNRGRTTENSWVSLHSGPDHIVQTSQLTGVPASWPLRLSGSQYGVHIFIVAVTSEVGLPC